MATLITEMAAVRTDGADAAARMTTPDAVSTQVVLGEDSEEFGTFLQRSRCGVEPGLRSAMSDRPGAASRQSGCATERYRVSGAEMCVVVEAEVTDHFLGELCAEFPELDLTISAGRTPLPHQRRLHHRRIEGAAGDIAVLTDRLSMAGLTWTALGDSR